MNSSIDHALTIGLRRSHDLSYLDLGPRQRCDLIGAPLFKGRARRPRNFVQMLMMESSPPRARSLRFIRCTAYEHLSAYESHGETHLTLTAQEFMEDGRRPTGARSAALAHCPGLHAFLNAWQ